MVTPLLLSAAGGHHEIVRLLLTNGAAVDHMDIVRNDLIDLVRYYISLLINVLRKV